jgi:hypothetical protein
MRRHCTICDHEALPEEQFIPVLSRHANTFDCIENYRIRVESLKERLAQAEAAPYMPEEL